MSFLVSIIPTLIVLGVLILIHELGHFIACRLTGVKVEKFSIGFGPEIFHWQGKETRYVLSLLPLGGFVKPQGESVSEVEETGSRQGDYLSAPLAARIFIVVAGVVMNYFLAVVLFTSVYMMGRPIPGTAIGNFVDGYPAKESALVAGDRVVQVNQTKVKNWNELTDAITNAPTPELLLLVERKTSPQRIELVPVKIEARVEDAKDVFGKEVQVRRLGITPHPASNEFERYGFLTSVQKSAQSVWTLAAMTHKAIFYMITGRMSLKTMAGPVGIIAMTGSAAELGLPYVLQLAATLSVSLAVINLLPIPALDGGHLLFLLIEGIRKKRVSLAAQEKAAQAGFVLLMVLMVFIVYNDLVNLDVLNKIKGMFGQ